MVTFLSSGRALNFVDFFIDRSFLKNRVTEVHVLLSTDKETLPGLAGFG